MDRSRSGMRRTVWSVVIASLSIGLMSTGVHAASAQQGGLCSGDVVVVFPNARLLNTEGARTAGPYPISLSPGTYLVTAGSFDAHGGDQITQPQEQWQMIADSGWASPFTVDVPDDAQTVVSTFNSQIIEAEVTSLDLFHLGQGAINSVTPVCAGFTKLADLEPESPVPSSSDPDGSEPTDSTTASTTTTDAPAATTTVSPVTTVAPATTTASRGPTTTAAPVATTAPSAVTTDAPDGTDGPDEIEPEVAGVTETAPVLARTGVSPLTDRFLGLGMFLVGFGGLVTVLSRRRAWTS